MILLNKIMRLTLLSISSLLITTSLFSAEVMPIHDFNSTRYLGTWYEIARIPFYFENGCIAPTTAHYAAIVDDTTKISVTNTCHKQGEEDGSATGIAYFVDTPNVGKLKVNFLPKYLRWLPLTSGDYWVLYTDYTGYALVGSPNHKYLWILARSEKIEPNKINYLLSIAKAQGFDINTLLFNYPFSMPKS